MSEDKTTKVSKELTVRYDILSDVIISSARIDMVSKLSDHPEGLRYNEIVTLIPEDRREPNLRDQLDELIKKNIVKDKGGGKYALSDLGKETYNWLVKVASRAKAEKIFSNP